SAKRRTVGGQRSRAPGSTIPSPATWHGSSEDIGEMRMNYGIIGCGMMGQEHLRNIALLTDTGVAAIFEPDDAMRGLAAAAAPDAKLVGSIEELLAVDAVNCLLISSPNYLHVEQLEKIAAIRPLPVLVEKPLFTKPEDMPRLAALKATYPAPILVAMEYRYMPPVAGLIDTAD